MTDRPALTVFYDGACPLCQKEIGLLRRLDRNRGRIRFEDVSPTDAAPSCPIDRETLMARFHVQLPSGDMAIGARAFTEAWSRIPWLIWLRPLGQFTPTRSLLDFLYRKFLKIRPAIQQRLVRGRSRA